MEPPAEAHVGDGAGRTDRLSVKSLLNIALAQLQLGKLDEATSTLLRERG